MTSFVLPCPLEDHDMLLQTKLDDGNIVTIDRVLEIEAHELVFLLLKPFLEHGKKTLDFGKKTSRTVATTPLVPVGDTNRD